MHRKVGVNEQFGCCGIKLYYGKIGSLIGPNFDNTQGGVWIYTLTGANETHRYWEHTWAIE